MRVFVTILLLMIVSLTSKMSARECDDYNMMIEKADSLLLSDAEQCIPITRMLLEVESIPDYEKERLMYILESAMKNRVGDVANDFEFLSKTNEYGSLHKLSARYVLVYFNDPTCDECAILKRELAESSLINELLDNDDLSLLSLCVIGKTADWELQMLPENWIDACDEKMTILDDELYYLPSLPMMYLLDENSKVLVKSAKLEKIEDFLRK